MLSTRFVEKPFVELRLSVNFINVFLINCVKYGRGCFVLEMLSCLGFVCVCVDDGNLSNVRDSRCRFPCWLVMRFIVWFGGTSIFFLLICFFIFLSSVLYMCFNGWIGLDWLCATFLTGLHLENRVLGEI